MPFIRDTCKIVIFIISALTYAEQPVQKAGEEVVDGLYIDGGGHQLAPLGIFTANLLQKQIHEDLLHCLGHIGFISSKLHHCQHYCSDHCLHLVAAGGSGQWLAGARLVTAKLCMSRTPAVPIGS